MGIAAAAWRAAGLDLLAPEPHELYPKLYTKGIIQYIAENKWQPPCTVYYSRLGEPESFVEDEMIQLWQARFSSK